MTKLVVIIGFCVAFAAGLTVGISRQRASVMQPSSPTTQASTRQTHRGGGFLASELRLTPQQQEQLNKIWSETARRDRSEQDDRRRQFRQQRDETIASLIRPEDKAKYEQAIKDYSDKTTSMDLENRERFKTAVEATKQVLTAEQRVKYEEMLSRHPFGGPGGGPGREWGRDRETTRRSDPAH